jgi:hypothetical protein
MEKDRFDDKMIDIEQKSYELGMLMSVFAFEILETFESGSADIAASVNVVNVDGVTVQVESEKVILNRDTGEISVVCSDMENRLLWDDLDLSAKNAIINELHFRYKADRLYKGLSDEGGIH